MDSEVIGRLAGERVLLIGGAGFIGHNLALSLAAGRGQNRRSR
jgi:nucleoside-diphosphate-sugar epimerase